MAHSMHTFSQHGSDHLADPETRRADNCFALTLTRVQPQALRQSRHSRLARTGNSESLALFGLTPPLHTPPAVHPLAAAFLSQVQTTVFTSLQSLYRLIDSYTNHTTYLDAISMASCALNLQPIT